ncbi:MAG TPA: nicotinate (nicotinamide) nucleotide adenylyltransferase [Elusimicrobiota bacterium]|nr:nicotinate (nicotinamide) nucleotide adenylyltransferase [Elusimicrobiota bacterium]
MPAKILVFGGSFDPPHKGHLALLSAVLERLNPDLALIVPACQAPLKNTPAAPAVERLMLTRLGLLELLPSKWRQKTLIDSAEISSRRRVYTFETLRRLRKKYPLAEFHFAVGADAAADFGRWKNQRELKAACRWWSANRPGAFAGIPPFFKKIPGRMPEISSTRVREALALGRDVRAWLAKPVARYIKSRGLYGLALLAELKKSLSPERFAHTLAVAGWAQSLAERWGADPDDARLAGLLHDWGRAVPVPRMPDYARTRRLKVPRLKDIARRQPLLLHAYISEDLARRRGLGGPAVRQAVRRHTLGGPGMTSLDRILYVADACSPDRKHAGAADLRRLALEDLDSAFSGCLRMKIEHALARGAWIHPLTVSLWNSRAD